MKMECEARPRHFFKIILEQTLREKKLQIPKAFVRKHGNAIPDKIQLEVPTGAVWKMEVSNDSGDLWVHNGWQNFADHHSLRYGHFLVFRYEGNGRFHVIIFDTTASEIEYPCPSICVEDDNPSGGIEDNNKEDDASVEILVSNSTSKKTREKPPLPCPPPCKIMRTRSWSKAKRNSTSVPVQKDFRRYKSPNREAKIENSGGEQNTFQTIGTTGAMLQRFRGERDSIFLVDEEGGHCKETRSQRNIAPGCNQIPSCLSKKLALKDAQNFEPKNPFFQVVLKKQHLEHGMYVPASIKAKLERRDQNATLQTKGGSWIVKLLSSHSRLSSGWCAFWRENSLQAGDLCVFELIKTDNVAFKVSIVKRCT